MTLVDRARAVGAWLDQRVGLGTPLAEVAAHPVPRSSASWWYVFGSATFIVFLRSCTCRRRMPHGRVSST